LIISAFVIVLFASYGNKKAHPSINEMIVNGFLGKNNDKKIASPEFKYYSFNGFGLPKLCKGTAMVENGFFSVHDVAWIKRMQGADGILYDAALTSTCTEGKAEMGVTEWIAHGGFSADVPEVPASLRHFYDPTKGKGDQYLTDITNARLMGAIQRVLRNPQMNGVEWAMGTPGDKRFDPLGHIYNWENGKAWMRMALETNDEDKRSEFLGQSYRALGEMLHMIADNGCPPHVRNDAHPSPVWGGNEVFGNPDPYEETMDVIRRDNPNDFIGFSKGTPNKELKDEIKEMDKAEDVAKALAVFTNKNFVTNETISGIDKYGNDKKQIINSSTPYSSPLLQDMSYNKADNSYISNSLGIKQCSDHKYFLGLWLGCEPEVDSACVRSQAAVLVPCIIESGSKVMELFIPKLEINIKSAEKGVVKGEIKHLKDAEYTTEIKYNGKANLVIKDKKFKIKEEETIMVQGGVFEASGLDFEKGDRIYASIDFGGMTVESPEFVCSDFKTGYAWIWINASFNHNSRIHWYRFENEQTMQKLSWQGKTFFTEFKDSRFSHKVSGTISEGPPQTVSGEVVSYYWNIVKGCTFYDEIKFQNVPYGWDDEGRIAFKFSSNNADIKSHISEFWNKTKCPGGKGNVTEIRWSEGGDITIGFYGI
jgi:hypothetical protein